MTKENEPLPLRYFISPPASFEEAVARTQVIAAQWFHYGTTCQKLIEGHLETIQASALTTMDKVRRHSLEAAFLQAPAKAETIELS
jgi:hypothetical protein